MNERLTSAWRRRMERERSPSAGCPDDEEITALMDGARDARVVEHLRRCTSCLAAYAELRSLVETAAQADSRSRRRPHRRVAMTAAAAAALAAAVWIVAIAERPAVRIVERAAPASDARAVDGRVEQVTDAGTREVPAHLVRLRNDTDEVYVIFVWGPADVRPGERARYEGVFIRATDAGVRFKGAATRVPGHAR